MRIEDISKAESLCRAKKDWLERLQLFTKTTVHVVSVSLDQASSSPSDGYAATLDKNYTGSGGTLSAMGLPPDLQKRLTNEVAKYCHARLVETEKRLDELGVEFEPYNPPDRDAQDTSGIIS